MDPLLSETNPGAVLSSKAAAAAPHAALMDEHHTFTLRSDPTSSLEHKFYFSESCRGSDVLELDVARLLLSP